MSKIESTRSPAAKNRTSGDMAEPGFGRFFNTSESIRHASSVARSKHRAKKTLSAGSAECYDCPTPGSPARGPHQKEEPLSYHSPDFRDRLTSAAKARNELLTKFKSAPGPDDPAVRERAAARQETIRAREARAAAREAARQARERESAAQAAREADRIAKAELQAAQAAAKLAGEEAELTALLAAEQAERDAALAAEQKAARDARYAARKAAKKERRRGF